MLEQYTNLTNTIVRSEPSVDKGACSYPVLFNAFKGLVSGGSVWEKTNLFAAMPHGSTD